MGAARPISEDPRVTLDASDWGAEEPTAPWCVDDGAGIRVMRTAALRQALREGRLGHEVKVWRDGRACWLPAAEVFELTAAESELPQSGVRRVATPKAEPDRWWQQTLLMIAGGILLGLGVIALLMPRQSPGPKRVERLPVAYAQVDAR
ncbi:MAG: GYF domain-containing protein [Polyangiaceae bacterium]